MTNTTLSGNKVTPGSGGGICSRGTLTVTNTTLSGNWAFGGGGISNNSMLAVANVTNTTLSGNKAGGLGGGIYHGERSP